MDVNAMAGGKWMTYAELGEVIGGSPEAGRQLALRLKLRKQLGNDNRRVRVWVEEDAVAGRSGRPEPLERPVPTPVQTPVQPDGPTGELKALREHLATLERLMSQQRADHATELERLRDDVDRARLDAARWHALADRERDTMHALLDQITEMAEGRAREAAEVVRLRAELEQVQRPWWRRLFR